MNGRFLLDTNIIITLFSKEPKIHAHLSAAEEIFIPCIAIGELYFGAYKSQNATKNIDHLEKL